MKINPWIASTLTALMTGENLRQAPLPESQSVPEPGMLFGLIALAGLGWCSRKQRQSEIDL